MMNIHKLTDNIQLNTKYCGCNPVDYNISDEVLLNSRRGMIREFFEADYRYKKTELFSSERIIIKKNLRKLRRIIIDVNSILQKRGYRIVKWKTPIILTPIESI